MFRANVQYSVDFAHWRHQLAVKAGLGCTADYHWHSSVDAVGFEAVSRALSWGWSTGVIFGGDGSIWRNGSFLLTMLSNLESTRSEFFIRGLILQSRVRFLWSHKSWLSRNVLFPKFLHGTLLPAIHRNTTHTVSTEGSGMGFNLNQSEIISSDMSRLFCVKVVSFSRTANTPAPPSSSSSLGTTCKLNSHPSFW